MYTISRIKRLWRGWSRWCRLGLICVVFLLWLTLRPHHEKSVRGLDVWLDVSQARKLLGVDVPYYFIQHDTPSASLSNAQTRHLSTKSRLQLSSATRYLNISFSAPAGYHYSIEDVTTSNPDLIGYPIFSIPTSGKVPSKSTVFTVEFPCSGQEAGTTFISFRIRFKSENLDGQDIKASPLYFQIEKECEKENVCDPPCAKGGVCNVEGKCDCKEGYYGPVCDRVICNPHCYNGGTCIVPGTCSCRKGFSGKYCHLASCKDNCYNHGRCIAPGKCKCYKNWFGDICQYPVTEMKPKSNIFEQREKEQSLLDFDMDQMRDVSSKYSSK